MAETMKVRLTLIDEALGMTPTDPEVYSRYIASKAPEDRKDEQGIAEGEKGGTVFPKTEDGEPFCWDYQIKGFFKDACGSLRRVPGSKSATVKAYKKIIDGTIFVSPRRIMLELPEGGEMGECERPLRISDARGERVALTTSETVPEGTALEFEVKLLNPHDAALVEEWLDYGELRGLFQWRNSGKGRFVWERLEG